MNDMSYLIPVIRKGYGAAGVVLKPSLYIKDNILMVRPRISDVFFSLLGMIPGVNLNDVHMPEKHIQLFWINDI